MRRNIHPIAGWETVSSMDQRPKIPWYVLRCLAILAYCEDIALLIRVCQVSRFLDFHIGGSVCSFPFVCFFCLVTLNLGCLLSATTTACDRYLLILLFIMVTRPISKGATSYPGSQSGTPPPPPTRYMTGFFYRAQGSVLRPLIDFHRIVLIHDKHFPHDTFST